MQHLRIGLVVLHTSPFALPGASDAGGMNVVVQAQATALAAAGHEVTVFTRRSDDAADSDDVAGTGVRLRFLPAGPPTALPKSGIDQHVDEFATALHEAIAAMAAEGALPHVLHSHHWMSGVAALDVAAGFGIPHLQSFHSIAATGTSHDLGQGEPPESPARVPGEARCAQESDGIIAVSRAEARTAVTRLGADPARVSIVGPGVDHRVFHAPEAPPAPGVIVAAARLQPLKGMDLAIEALAHISPDIRPKLVIAGAGSADFADYEAELHRLIETHSLEGHVEFVGALGRADLASLLRSATLTLVPSHSETYGLIALESAACGAPIIASAAGGLPEAVGDGGLLLDNRDPAEWGAAIESLLRDDARLAAMRTAALTHAASRTWEQSAAALEAHYWGAASPEAWLPDGDGPVVLLHAHPDDESIQTGALMHALSRHVRVDLITATRGERGEVVPGPLSALAGTPELDAHRRGELARAIALLGVTQHAFLGTPPARQGAEPRRYRDSGMRWVTETLAGPAEDAPADSLTSATIDETAADIAAYLKAVDARALITYDRLGGYGHPDHVRCHEAGLLAAELAGVAFIEVLSPENTDDGPSTPLALGQHAGPVLAALREHASQITVDGADLVHSGGQRTPIIHDVELRRAR